MTKGKKLQFQFNKKPIEKPTNFFIESNSGVFDFDDFKERYELLLKPVWSQIEGLGGGWTDKNIQVRKIINSDTEPLLFIRILLLIGMAMNTPLVMLQKLLCLETRLLFQLRACQI